MNGISLMRVAGIVSAFLVASFFSFPSFPGSGTFTLAPLSVDRSLKGDRLSPAAPEISPGELAPAMTSPPPQTQTHGKAPFGCEGAFSPISSPQLANVFRRCMT
jgi:hypothetical protein